MFCAVAADMTSVRARLPSRRRGDVGVVKKIKKIKTHTHTSPSAPTSGALKQALQ
jgi:hypothetical protein